MWVYSVTSDRLSPQEAHVMLALNELYPFCFDRSSVTHHTAEVDSREDEDWFVNLIKEFGLSGYGSTDLR